MRYRKWEIRAGDTVIFVKARNYAEAQHAARMRFPYGHDSIGLVTNAENDRKLAIRAWGQAQEVYR